MARQLAMHARAKKERKEKGSTRARAAREGKGKGREGERGERADHSNAPDSGCPPDQWGCNIEGRGETVHFPLLLRF